MTPEERAKKQAEVMLAYANGAEIEYEQDAARWVGVPDTPSWDWRRVNYRVKKPAPKVVKLSAYITEKGQLIYYDMMKVKTWQIDWKRIQSLDLEYTEDES